MADDGSSNYHSEMRHTHCTFSCCSFITMPREVKTYWAFRRTVYQKENVN